MKWNPLFSSRHARDELTAVLKSEKTDLVLLGAQLDSAERGVVLRSLQGDSLLAQQDHLQDVQQESIAEVPQANCVKQSTIWSE